MGALLLSAHGSGVLGATPADVHPLGNPLDLFVPAKGWCCCEGAEVVTPVD